MSRFTNLILDIFSISETVFEIFRKKTVFEKTLSDATVSWNVLTWVKLRCFFIFYFHVNGSIGIVQKNRLRDKTGFGDVQPPKRREKWFWTIRLWVCLSVLLSVCLAVAFPASSLTGVRLNRSSWNFRGMSGYIGHCAVPIFEAIREPVYKII